MLVTRPKTTIGLTIGLGAPIEVFIYYLWPPAVVCHRGPPSTTRARVDRRTGMLAKSLNYRPRQARALQRYSIQIDPFFKYTILTTRNSLFRFSPATPLSINQRPLG